MRKIVLPQDVLADVPNWTENPSLFFCDEGSKLDLEFDPIPGMYKYLDGLTVRRTIDKIRERFVKIVYHRLKERLSLGYIRSDCVDDVLAITSKSGLISHESDDIKSKITRWSKLGKKLDTFCLSIGGSASHDNWHLGNLFCLPEDCHDEL
jgi:hypothetical protein